MKTKKVKYGVLEVELKWVVLVRTNLNTFKFVTKAENNIAEWEDGKQAMFFTKDDAEFIASTMNWHNIFGKKNIACFTMAVPEIFEDKQFINE